ncbi:cytochrome c oxidase subunit II [Haloarchaeobius sp. TZWWS8]|uniref:cytochrome c oxidase subunit II n=1 Tax=Haloarchaeobius sp. TZWWS8 TaxID=3446121 RepID=UPI003EBF358D
MYEGLVIQTGGVGSGGLVPRGTRVEIFQEIFYVFLALGTLVGVVVLGYMVWNAYKYRDHEGRTDDDEEGRPVLGEVPTGGGHGRKLLLSFSISAIIVLSLILWTYGALLFVESPASADTGNDVDTMEVKVVGYQFGWQFEYENGVKTDGTLRVPEGTRVHLTVTSRDVMHNFGVPALKAKTDAIPGQTTETWFGPVEQGNYTAQCYELCGAGHSYMTAQIVVMDQGEFDQWYANAKKEQDNASNGNQSSGNSSGTTTEGHSGRIVSSGADSQFAVTPAGIDRPTIRARAFSA